MFRRKKKHSEKSNARMDALACRIAIGIVQAQTWAAGRLGQLERRCSATQKKCLLAAFCLLFGSYCLYLLVMAFL